MRFGLEYIRSGLTHKVQRTTQEFNESNTESAQLDFAGGEVVDHSLHVQFPGFGRIADDGRGCAQQIGPHFGVCFDRFVDTAVGLFHCLADADITS
jgi:hypothetical protein